MLFNWRVSRWIGECDSPISSTDLGYCYQGRSQKVFTLALLAAVGWDGTPENPPLRWNKEVHTGRWVDPPGYLPEEAIADERT